MLNLVDSSGWIEYFAGGWAADAFAGPVADPDNLIVPTVVIYEVVKRLLRQWDWSEARFGYVTMRQGTVVDLDERLALDAASISLAQRLPMADSMILATARAYGATVWTQDSHFDGLEGVHYVPHRG